MRDDGRLGEAGSEQLLTALSAAAETAGRWAAPDPLVFATSVVRDAPDRADVLRAVHHRTGLILRVLPVRWGPGGRSWVPGAGWAWREARRRRAPGVAAGRSGAAPEAWQRPRRPTRG
ncbi:hypothetical protein [Streptomyces sp. TLI_185]|uniref:hypothetical protein n=1 Tax=Streptomyces sp. TLI_185 TaxID=2485151 RepID=UPI0026CBF126